MSKNLEKILAYKFRNSLLLAEALTHPSLAYESKRPHFDNQRLEFLGDAVLQLVLTHLLFQNFPNCTEGELTKMRSCMVSKKALYCFAQRIRLGEFVMLGKGEEATGGRTRDSTLADAFEALLGAIYLDGGLAATEELITRLLAEDLKTLTKEDTERNPKGRLQEYLQAIVPEAPAYELIRSEGPDHKQTFWVRVLWQGKELATGVGNSKKNAEVNAARNALHNRAWKTIK